MPVETNLLYQVHQQVIITLLCIYMFSSYAWLALCVRRLRQCHIVSVYNVETDQQSNFESKLDWPKKHHIAVQHIEQGIFYNFVLLIYLYISVRCSWHIVAHATVCMQGIKHFYNYQIINLQGLLYNQTLHMLIGQTVE